MSNKNKILPVFRGDPSVHTSSSRLRRLRRKFAPLRTTESGEAVSATSAALTPIYFSRTSSIQSNVFMKDLYSKKMREINGIIINLESVAANQR